MSNTAFTEGNRVGANNIVFEGNPAPANIFANLEALRLSPDAAAVAGTMEILSHVPIRKPNRHEFFRTRPEPEMWFDTGVFEDKEERENFFVKPAMLEAIGRRNQTGLVGPDHDPAVGLAAVAPETADGRTAA